MFWHLWHLTKYLTTGNLLSNLHPLHLTHLYLCSLPPRHPLCLTPSQLPSLTPCQPPCQPPSLTPCQPPSLTPCQPPRLTTCQPPSLTPYQPPSLALSLTPCQPPSLTPSQPDTLPATQHDTLPATQHDTLPATQSDTLPATQTDTMPPTQSDTLPATQHDTLPATQPDTMPAAQPDTMPATQPDTMPATQPDTMPATQPDTMPATQPDTMPATQPDTMPATQPDTMPATQPDTMPATQPDTMPATQPDTMPATQPDTMPATQPDTMPAMQTGQQAQEEGVTRHVLPVTSSATTALNVVVVHSPPCDMPPALSLAPSSTPLPSTPVRCPPVMKRLESIHRHRAGATRAQASQAERMVKRSRIYHQPGQVGDSGAVPIPFVDRDRGISLDWSHVTIQKKICTKYKSEMVSWKDNSPGISFNFLQKQMWDKTRHCHSVEQSPNSQGVGDKDSQNAIVEPKGVKPIGVSEV